MGPRKQEEKNKEGVEEMKQEETVQETKKTVRRKRKTTPRKTQNQDNTDVSAEKSAGTSSQPQTSDTIASPEKETRDPVSRSKADKGASTMVGEERSQYPRKGKQDLNKLGEVENIYNFSTLQGASNAQLVKYCKELEVPVPDMKLKKMLRLDLYKLILERKSAINGFDFV